MKSTDSSNRFGVVIKENQVQLRNWAEQYKPINKIRLLPADALNLAAWIFALTNPTATEMEIRSVPVNNEIQKVDGKIFIPLLPVCAFECLEPRMRISDAVQMA